MTHVEKALQLASDNGYLWDTTGQIYCQSRDGKFLCHSDTMMGNMVPQEKFFLDRKFWIALGKGKGWKTIWGTCQACFLTGFGARSDDCTCEMNSWRRHWLIFVDHLAQGGDAESFFAELLK